MVSIILVVTHFTAACRVFVGGLHTVIIARRCLVINTFIRAMERVKQK